jgi:hypothetical protein
VIGDDAVARRFFAIRRNARQVGAVLDDISEQIDIVVRGFALHERSGAL